MRTVDDFARWAQIIRPYYFDKLTTFPDEKAVRNILERNPRLVLAVSHGPGFSPAFINAAIVDIFLKNGGAQRRLLSVAWRQFYKVPILKQLTAYFTQLDKPRSREQLLEMFVSDDFTDFVVFPEGENSVYGNGDTIEPFMSPRFLEIAITAKVPVLIIVHDGAQKSAKRFHITEKQSKWIGKISPKNASKLEQAGEVFLPSLVAGKLTELKVYLKLYKPKPSLKTLPENEEQRLVMLNKEAAKVRAIMQKMLNQLKCSSSDR